MRLYNTLKRKKETFKPINKNIVRMYSCGPTVYSYQHIGNMRTYIFTDLLKRALNFNGFKVKQIINVTDVGHLVSDSDEGEDKVELAAKKEGKKAKEITKFYFDRFLKEYHELNLQEPDFWPKASEHIQEQIDLIKELEKKGYTYRTSDGIYFDSSKFKDYGKLSGIKIDNLEEGKRVEMREKRNKTDFALWKFSNTKRDQEWNSPWGKGFPGWHIECSAMAMKYLGETFDIHTGGIDHIPVHHTNEIAQSEGANSKKFVNYWVHAGFLLNNGEKVSKSKGGFYTISDLKEKGYDPIAFRYLCLQTHYRKPLQFTLEALEGAQNALNRIRSKFNNLQDNDGKDKTKTYLKDFMASINDNLNMPQALEATWNALNDEDFDNKKKRSLILKFDEVLGLKLGEKIDEKIPNEIVKLVEKRNEFRRNKLWADADKIRRQVESKGYIIEDNAEGTKIIKNN